ncbi:flavodoxin reductase [Tateyamaria omphalii]|uniref:FAD-binding oxidoreductase n=1 Tax=Tateyamaria omphalii TaxID=299262 RepID=UPI001C9995C3|nr:FAD-binding oxidoreductase [Tateyamaria omphalii]MBY5933777.1 flavodoxin reductase [Tateyamaria omphalii]
MPHTLTLREVAPLTHDTNRYVFGRPANFDFEPGQAAELAICRDGWRDAPRPFTFTSLPDDDQLEFVIKSYPEKDGVTEELADIEPGTVFELDGPFGAIEDKGAGVFLAAGAGVTPFIAILRNRARQGAVDGCHLIYSNTCAKDIILRHEWDQMDGLSVDHVLSDEQVDGLHHGEVDTAFLREHVSDTDQMFYICGPQAYVDAMRDGLQEIGVKTDKIVTEDGW